MPALLTQQEVLATPMVYYILINAARKSLLRAADENGDGEVTKNWTGLSKRCLGFF